MAKTIYVNCPVCEELLEVNSENGRVIKHHVSKTKGKSKEEAFLEALNDTKGRESKLTKQFEASKEAEKDKLKKLEEQFKEKKNKVDPNDEGDKPIRPFDLD